MRNDLESGVESNQPTLRFPRAPHTANLQPQIPPGEGIPDNYPQVPGYEILGILGSGGMGVVYKARQRSLNRLVALKMIRPDVDDDPEVLARFQVEADAIARLHHPGIVRVYEVGCCEGRPFLCLEFIAGTTLEDWIDGKPKDPLAAAEMAAQLADALNHAHGYGIIHRDLKPANVLLDEAEKPHLTDFGIARFLEGDSRILTRNGDLLGTPAYMAPEQAGEGTIDATTDVYALGVILYELLTGRPPFVAPTGLETIRLVLNAEPVPPRRLQPTLPRDLETIVLKCLRKESSQRYQSAHAVAEDLRRWLTGQPIVARPMGRLQRLARWCGRNPGTASLALALLVTVLSMVALAGIWFRTAEARRFEEARQAEKERHERAALEQTLQDDFAQIEAGLDAEDWKAARAALHHATGVLQKQALPEHVQRLEHYHQALALVATFERIQARMGRAKGGSFDLGSRDADYRACLEPLGVVLESTLDDAWLVPLEQSPVRGEIVRALDDWASLRTNMGDAAGCFWLLALNNRIDRDAWQRAVRQEYIDRDYQRLEERARTPEGMRPTLDQSRLLGTLLRLTGRDEVTKTWLRIAQREYPGDFVINNSLGSLLLDTSTVESLQEARGCFRAALAVRPGAAGVQLNLGVALRKLNRPLEALEAYRRAAELQPDYAMAYTNQGLVHLTLGRLDEAGAAFERAGELEPDNPASLYMIVRVRLRQNRVEEARSLLRQIAERGLYRFDSMQTILGELHARGLPRVEIEERQNALTLDPNNPDLYYDQGTTLMNHGRYSEAVAHLKRARELSEKVPQYHCNLGQALVELGRFDEGVEALCRGHRLGTETTGWTFPSDRWIVESYELACMARRLETTPGEQLLANLEGRELENLGRVAAIQGKYVLATRAYLRSRQAEGSPATAFRWLTARAALRAGLGHGDEPPDVEQRESYHRLARDLMAQELTDLQNLLARNDLASARRVSGYLDSIAEIPAVLDLNRLMDGPLPSSEMETGWREFTSAINRLHNLARKRIEAAAGR